MAALSKMPVHLSFKIKLKRFFELRVLWRNGCIIEYICAFIFQNYFKSIFLNKEFCGGMAALSNEMKRNVSQRDTLTFRRLMSTIVDVPHR